MSAKATFWAWHQKIKPATSKLVLLCLADCHNDGNGQCNPGVEYISRVSGLDRKTVISALANLEAIGAIRAEKEHGRSNQYTLLTSPEIGTGTENGTSTEIGTAPVPKTVLPPVPKTVPEPISEPKRNLKDNVAPEYISCAEWMWSLIQPVTQSPKKPNLKSWAGDIRKLSEIDKRPLPVIAAVFKWANTDKFWRANILSPKKLREKFDNLFAQMEAANGTNNPGRGIAAPKQTAAQRIAARREQLAAEPPIVGTVAEDDRDVWPQVDEPAGRGTQRYMAAGS